MQSDSTQVQRSEVSDALITEMASQLDLDGSVILVL